MVADSLHNDTRKQKGFTYGVLRDESFITCFPERKTGITGMPFGRTYLSFGAIGTSVQALLHRHGPVGPSFQGMLETIDFIF